MAPDQTAPRKKPVLLCYGIGNPDRGDDALGPALLEWLAGQSEKIWLYDLVLEQPFQLQPENLYEMADADAIVFMDASVDSQQRVRFSAVTPQVSRSAFVTHALSPEHLLALHQSIMETAPPPAYLLSMGAVSMDLGESISEQGLENLEHAKNLLASYLKEELASWQETMPASQSAVF